MFCRSHDKGIEQEAQAPQTWTGNIHQQKNAIRGKHSCGIGNGGAPRLGICLMQRHGGHDDIERAVRKARFVHGRYAEVKVVGIFFLAVLCAGDLVFGKVKAMDAASGGGLRGKRKSQGTCAAAKIQSRHFRAKRQTLDRRLIKRRVQPEQSGKNIVALSRKKTIKSSTLVSVHNTSHGDRSPVCLGNVWIPNINDQKSLFDLHRVKPRKEFFKKISNISNFILFACSHGIVHHAIKLRMKIHVLLMRCLALFRQKHIQTGHFQRVLGLVGQALALQPAQQLRNAALGDAQLLGQSTHMDAFIVVDGHDCVDFRQMDIHICTEFAALALKLIKPGHYAQQRDADWRAARRVGGSMPHGFDHGFLDAQFNGGFFMAVIFHGVLVWHPYFFVNRRAKAANSCAAAFVSRACGAEHAGLVCGSCAQWREPYGERMKRQVVCPHCGEPYSSYKNPTPTADVVIYSPDRGVVIISRANEPVGFALPGGFIEEGECAETAAVREMREETGLDVELTGLLGVYSRPDRDPRQHTLTVAFTGRPRNPEALCAGDDAAHAAYYPLDALPQPLVFDHAQILADFRAMLADKRSLAGIQPSFDAVAGATETCGEGTHS